ncbi:hypothetical protein [Tautonia plasticadhaerens]|uniref:Uncharacterized protein n=1 Tax=Tautonia plasticadhaerens TaxID=2527974 RepID=A0A518GUH5_9BACT|nr:hypothetical protein [Tautonia plasticadhaerens]QDV32242.1 hypothetical protein ElP_00650 [Tautonia plasticadhaerens]
MDRNLRALAWSLAASALLALGCSLVKPDSDAPLSSSIASASGEETLAELLNPRRLAMKAKVASMSSEEQQRAAELLDPERIALKVMIATRPIDEPSLRDAIWAVADEHALDADLRLRLEANGLRVGVVDGSMPPEVEELLSPEAPQGERIDPLVVAVPNGHATPIMVGPDEPVDRKTLFLSLANGAVGRDYENARAAIRVSASRDGDAIGLRVVPEIHHGFSQLRYAPADNLGPFEPEQFVMRDGQQEESFRDLAASLTIAPGQVLVLGCWPDRPGSLGHFHYTKLEPKSDRLLQSVVFLWATPTGPTEIPWVEPVSPPSNLRRVDPSELGVGESQ